MGNLAEREPDGVAEESVAALRRVPGRSMISQTVVNHPDGGIWALRCAVGNARTERRHLEQLWSDLREVAAAIV